MPQSRINIAYVVNSLNPGGTEKLVLQMSRALSKSYDMSVLCLDEPGVWADDLRESGVPVHCLWRQPGLDVGMAVKIYRFCKRRRIHIIHAHQCTPWFYSGLSRLLYGFPKLLLEEHGRHYPEVENQKRMYMNKWLIAPLTHKFVAVSKDVRKRLVQYEGLADEKIEVVYNGVTAAQPISEDKRMRLRNVLGIEPDEFVVGTVGRMDPIKNLPLLLKCLCNARDKRQDIRGLLVGDGPCFEEIEKKRDALDLSRYVTMTGFRSDARQLIQCMDLFVLSSFSEGTSMALLEAMAAGVPVVVTDVGGNPEIVLKNETGWVVPSDCHESMTGAILEAAKNTSKREKFSSEGKLCYRERFSFDAMLVRYRDIYQQLIS